MYKFEGPQEYTHPDQVIKSAGKTERYSNTGNSYLHEKCIDFTGRAVLRCTQSSNITVIMILIF